MNAAVRAVVRMGIYLGCKVYFIREGYQGEPLLWFVNDLLRTCQFFQKVWSMVVNILWKRIGHLWAVLFTRVVLSLDQHDVWISSKWSVYVLKLSFQQY